MSLLRTCFTQLSKSFVKNLSRTGPRFDSENPSDFELQHQEPICVKTETIPLALYGGRHTVTMLPGTGIGPELCKFVREVFNTMGAPIDFEIHTIDPKEEGRSELTSALVSIKRNGVAIKGNIETRIFNFDPNARLSNLRLRNELDLYVYVLRCKSYPGVPSKHKDVDIVVIRQNIEGEYAMLEHSIGGEKVVENLKIVTRHNSMRLARYAFEYAIKYGRKKVTTVHKANIMKLSDGMFLKMSKLVAEAYPQIKHDDMIIDNCCMQLVSKPQQFDVLLAPNLYASILANVICGITGGPGLVSGRNYGDHYAIFEPGTRNTGTTIAGKNMANPVAMLNASIDMLHHLGHDDYVKRLDHAIHQTICIDKVHTPDLGGTAKSTEVIEKILTYL